MAYKVEKNIPLSSPLGFRWNTKYPWPEMEDGDSFIIPLAESKAPNSLMISGNDWCRRNNPSLRCLARVEEDGVRVWLIAREKK